MCACSETVQLELGLTIELWNKGMLWDKLLGTHWLPLTNVKFSNKVRVCVCVRGDVMLWDKLLGTHWLPLTNVKFSNKVRVCVCVRGDVMLWDKLLGTHWLPLTNVKFSNKVRACVCECVVTSCCGTSCWARTVCRSSTSSSQTRYVARAW